MADKHMIRAGSIWSRADMKSEKRAWIWKGGISDKLRGHSL